MLEDKTHPENHDALGPGPARPSEPPPEEAGPGPALPPEAARPGTPIAPPDDPVVGLSDWMVRLAPEVASSIEMLSTAQARGLAVLQNTRQMQEQGMLDLASYVLQQKRAILEQTRRMQRAPLPVTVKARIDALTDHILRQMDDH
ncbi:hypothetical protein [Oleisolibacter albus]|uniref:hypothetical protein n=1 Tax=Oleisolibacter albus TaxID=2171757 RepID=UPI000DF3467A|nr:hypothetical protein [Oleisolibacter albus]